MRKMGTIVLLIFGSFCIYCVQNTVGTMKPGPKMGSGNGDGMVPDAQAQSPGSCCMPPSPTVIFDQETVPTVPSDEPLGCVSPTWDLSGYGDVVVHFAPGQTCGGTGITLQQRFGIVGFLNTSVNLCTMTQPVLLHVNPHDGSQLRVSYHGIANTDCVNTKWKITVVGWK
jgi:hypothetical protein